MKSGECLDVGYRLSERLDTGRGVKELKALADHHAELHADRARLQAGVDRLAGDLEQARRPWWQLIGR
jgi:hypothetical protein